MKLKLKEKSGSFELWTEGASRAFVMVASGEPDQPHRVAVELFSAFGSRAAESATYVFNKLNQAMSQATNSQGQAVRELVIAELIVKRKDAVTSGRD